jgi:hypothetical protein
MDGMDGTDRSDGKYGGNWPYRMDWKYGADGYNRINRAIRAHGLDGAYGSDWK